MKKSYRKDILRTIRKNFKRFMALLCITALGITVFNGICAACDDMYLAADRFYDEQQLFDIRVLSTLGLTDDDVSALQEIKGVKKADGSYSETVYTDVKELRFSAELIMLSTGGLNKPYVTKGKLPEKSGEVAVTQKYLDESGKKIGDSVEIEEEMEEEDTDSEEQEVEPKEEEDIDFDVDASVEIEEEPESPNFKNTVYTITGVVINPMDVGNNDGSTAFRSSSVTDFTFFVTPWDVDTDVYTAVYLTLNGLDELNTYSDEYEKEVKDVIELIETKIMEQREQARYEEILAEAVKKINDAEDTMNEKFSEADEKFADAWEEIRKAKEELTDGENELTREEEDALKKLADARKELEDGKAQLADAQAELDRGEEELASNAVTIQEGRAQLEEERQKAEAGFTEAEETLTEQESNLKTSRSQALSQVKQLKSSFGEGWPETEWNALVNGAAAKTAELIGKDPENEPDGAQVAKATQKEQNDLATALGIVLAGTNTDPTELIANCIQAGIGLGMIEGSIQVLDAQKGAFEEQKAAAEKQINDAQAELDEGERLLNEGRVELENGRAQLNTAIAEAAEGEDELNAEEKKALREIADAWKEIEDGKKELEENEVKLEENEAKYLEKKEEAQQKLAEAYEELDDIDMTRWYVQDRTSLDSYTGLDSDVASINAIGEVFPILFLVVAVLISLTTMTRMVEEERGLIGTYKALGYGNLAIGWKYLCYALLATLAGGIIGNFMGFVVLPKLLMVVLQEMYIIPEIPLYFNAARGFTGVLLFAVSILGATAFACQNELRQTPASLMRPKTPRAGTRIVLERVTFIWSRLRFLNKVTARNLFRYKKRLIMTVFGIAGCTALVLVGFAIKDSVSALIPKQYEEIYKYDMMVVANADDNEELLQLLEENTEIKDYLSVQVETIKVYNEKGETESVQLIIVPEGDAFTSYIRLNNKKGQEQLLDDNSVFLTENAADLLNINAGDSITLQDMELNRFETKVTEIAENYLGNSIYMTQKQYESISGQYDQNGVYMHILDEVKDHTAISDSLMEHDFVLSTVSIQAMKDNFIVDFAILNAVIYGLIVFAAGLAFIVLFTLSNTNISERIRELATIKVLGFFDGEVHAYVNKETLILTFIGVLTGLPMGYVLSGLILLSLKMPSIQFVLVIHPSSYLISGVIAFSFAIIVNFITNVTLNKINMVEALKSVE